MNNSNTNLTDDDSICQNKEYSVFVCDRPHLSIVFLALTAVFAVSAIFGNILLLVSIYKFSQLRSITNIFLCNLSVSSLFICLGFIVDVLTKWGLTSSLTKECCLIRSFCVTLMLLNSVYSIVGMSVERFIAVVYPLRYKVIVTRSRVRNFLIASWASFCIIAALPLFGWNTDQRNDDESCYLTKHFTMEYNTLMFTLVFVGNTVNIVLFSKVIYVIRSVKKRNYELNKNNPSNKKTVVVFLVMASFVVCWMPFIIFAIVHVSSGIDDNDIQAAWAVGLRVGLFNSSSSWILYGVLKKSFRRAFKALLCCNTSRIARASISG